VVYVLFCKHCDKFIYVGETGDTLYQRHLLNAQFLLQGSHLCSCLKNIELCFLWTKISFKFLSCLNAKISGFMNTFFIFSDLWTDGQTSILTLKVISSRIYEKFNTIRVRNSDKTNLFWGICIQDTEKWNEKESLETGIHKKLTWWMCGCYEHTDK
jgi:hypothetical protein